MDAQSIFTTASIMVLANGAILAAICRELPAALRPAAIHWCLGTLLVAVGCLSFAFGAPLPRTLMLTLANGAFAFGLTAYYVAIRHFLRLEVKPLHFLPGAVATMSVLWFSSIMPNFQIRMAIVSIVWTGLMAVCVNDLRDTTRGSDSLARTILTTLFALVGLYAIARGTLYLASDIPTDFSVESGSNWLNVLSAILMTLLPVVGTTAFLLMCSDRLRRGLERAATTDHLTGLPNRRGFAGAGAEAFLAARAKQGEFALAVFDLDKFKRINDTYGHDAGDRALMHAAGRLRAVLRPTDMIARTGGEEFVVLFRDLAPSEAADIAERMRASVEESTFVIDGNRVPLTTSAGIAFHHAGDATYDDVMRRADRALYLAKATGRNRLEIASTDASENDGQQRLILQVPPLSGLEDIKADDTQPASA